MKAGLTGHKSQAADVIKKLFFRWFSLSSQPFQLSLSLAGFLSSVARRRYRPTSSLRPGHSDTARATQTVGTQQPPSPSCVLDQQLVRRPATDFAPKLPTSAPTGTILVPYTWSHFGEDGISSLYKDKYLATAVNAISHQIVQEYNEISCAFKLSELRYEMSG